MNKIQTEVKPGQLYKHFKGREYVVMSTALHHNNLEPWVVYSSISKIPSEVEAYIRPLKEFLEVLPDGTQRFKLAKEDDTCDAVPADVMWCPM